MSLVPSFRSTFIGHEDSWKVKLLILVSESEKIITVAECCAIECWGRGVILPTKFNKEVMLTDIQ